MALLILNPETSESNGKYKFDMPGTKRMRFSYMHGELERENGYDIFGIVGDLPKAGIHPIQVLGSARPATLFVWNDGMDLTALAVYNDDVEGYAYAKEAYENKHTV